MTKPYIVVVSPKEWDMLDLSDPVRRRTALCAFYNGYGTEQLKSLMSQPMDHRECVDLRSCSEFLGLQPSDDIVRSGNEGDRQGDGPTGL